MHLCSWCHSTLVSGSYKLKSHGGWRKHEWSHLLQSLTVYKLTKMLASDFSTNKFSTSAAHCTSWTYFSLIVHRLIVTVVRAVVTVNVLSLSTTFSELTCSKYISLYLVTVLFFQSTSFHSYKRFHPEEFLLQSSVYFTYSGPIQECIWIDSDTVLIYDITVLNFIKTFMDAF